MRCQPGSVVYVLDDDASVRGAIESLLRSVDTEVRSFASPREFLDRPPCDATACLVLDVRLPGTNGLDLQRELAEREPGLPIVFITGHGDIRMSVRAIKAGAVEFLPKPFRDQDLLAAIEEGLQAAHEARRRRDQRAELQARSASLTPRERQVLELVVAGMLNKHIASQLGISEVTVKIHRGQVMQKMRAASVADLVRMVDRAQKTPSPSPR
jgi:RNA polymerase sigma factor (sigma-70 family)